MSPHRFTRREIISLAGKAALVGALAPRLARGAEENSAQAFGAVVGDPIAAKIGETILKDGGNAIDAAIAAAFAAGICTARNSGIGGYGGHAMIALTGGKKITAIDFNSAAPAAARADMFPLDTQGRVVGNANTFGWLAAGVPGVAAGLDLALQRYGTRPLRDVLAPAIQMCEEGRYAAAVKGIDDLAPAGPVPPEKRRNLALAALLKTLAARNSTESFYRGDIARTITTAFQSHGGLVTVEDLAAFRARELEPLTLDWNGARLHTVPLTSTGLLLLEACSILKSLDWPKLSAPQRQHARLEALRIAWADRLRTFGDPEQVSVPVEKFLSPAYAGEQVEKISTALRAQQPVPLVVEPSNAGGTTNISATDRHGNMIAITVTHGGSFGSRAVVPELGMVLGHGMSRFDPRPGRPNSVGPGKRPITNMCPTIVTRGGMPVLAVGGAGGTRIPNSVYEVLLNFVGLGASLDAALAAPRVQTDGTLALGLDKAHSPADHAFFKKLGYTVARSPNAYVGAVTRDPMTGESRGAASGGA